MKGWILKLINCGFLFFYFILIDQGINLIILLLKTFLKTIFKLTKMDTGQNIDSVNDANAVQANFQVQAISS